MATHIYTAVDKEADALILTEDGVKRVQQIRLEDTVISVPTSGFKKVTNIYVTPEGKLQVDYET